MCNQWEICDHHRLGIHILWWFCFWSHYNPNWTDLCHQQKAKIECFLSFPFQCERICAKQLYEQIRSIRSIRQTEIIQFKQSQITRIKVIHYDIVVSQCDCHQCVLLGRFNMRDFTRERNAIINSGLTVCAQKFQSIQCFDYN